MKTIRFYSIVCLPLIAVIALCAMSIAPASAGAVRGITPAGILAPNDDGSTGLVGLGFTANFFGTSYTDTYVNNNGNVTFDGAMGTYTPFGLLGTTRQIIAPFFGDVDTRPSGSDVVRYGTDVVGGRSAFVVNWAGTGVGYFADHVDKLNMFQLLLIDRSDILAGDFDIEFNYDQMQWETGDASGGSGGLGGYPARAGFSNGTTYSYELPGSGVSGAFLDGGPDSLVGHSYNSGVAGRYVYEVRNGHPITPSVPEPGAFFLAAMGLPGMLALARRRRQA